MSAELSVLLVDNHLLAVRKPVCVPTVPDESGDESLLDLARRWVEQEFNKPGRAFLGVVHRLDRPVSGVVLFARTSKAAQRLTDSFKLRRVSKTYQALTTGWPREESGEVIQWLRKSPHNRRVVVAAAGSAEAKEARTRWRCVRRWTAGTERRALLELVPETGRKHQLRVAMASLGLPLVGDLKYGAERALPDRSVALHARALELDHPVREMRVLLEAPLPRTAWWREATDARAN